MDRSLKPVVIVAVGDVALSLGGAKFARFAPWLIELLVQAGVTPYDAGPPNWQVSYIPKARISVFTFGRLLHVFSFQLFVW